MNCNICPRQCKYSDKEGSTGFCGISIQRDENLVGASNGIREIKLARAALHFYEEPCISGTNGSGAVFFSGCNLRCVFCQNHNIANCSVGKAVSLERLADIFLELQEKEAHNINLVTPSHYAYQIIDAIKLAREKGLSIPVVYNTSAYDSVEALKALEGYVDVYLPDYKYADSSLAASLSNAGDYPDKAIAAIREMIRQVGMPVVENGIIKNGVIIRHLVLPGNVRNSKAVIDRLVSEFGTDITLSIMNQYTPIEGLQLPGELGRTVTEREYNKVLDYAFEKGLVNGFFQDGETCKESFIPAFDYEGV